MRNFEPENMKILRLGMFSGSICVKGQRPTCPRKASKRRQGSWQLGRHSCACCTSDASSPFGGLHGLAGRARRFGRAQGTWTRSYSLLDADFKLPASLYTGRKVHEPCKRSSLLLFACGRRQLAEVFSAQEISLSAMLAMVHIQRNHRSDSLLR